MALAFTSMSLDFTSFRISCRQALTYFCSFFLLALMPRMRSVRDFSNMANSSRTPKVRDRIEAAFATPITIGEPGGRGHVYRIHTVDWSSVCVNKKIGHCKKDSSLHEGSTREIDIDIYLRLFCLSALRWKNPMLSFLPFLQITDKCLSTGNLTLYFKNWKS